MKLFFTLIFFSSVALAGEVKTDCPMMREMMRRENPKSQNKISHIKTRSSSVSSQSIRE
jgi:hypothetical protein